MLKSTILPQPIGQEKCMKYVSFPWPPLEATLSIFNVTLFAKRSFFENKEINTQKKIRIAISAKS